ncbi:MAG TPA: ABC transporter permease subunit [Armatimonadota bacterium]|jgi:NitT/TauT family transport system permease protein
MKALARRTLFYLGLLVLWQLLASAKVWDEVLFPGPLKVWEALRAGFADGSYPIALAVSGKRLAIGFGVSLVGGVALGLLLGRVRLLDETLGSLVSGLQVLPSICWLPSAILWFGISEAAILFVVIMGALLAVAVAVDGGVKSVPPVYLRQARTMGVSGPRLWLEVILPASLPALLTGAKLGWSFAWRSLMAGELLSISMGLGSLLQTGRDLNDMSQVFAVMLLIAGAALAVDRLVFGPLERRVRRVWGLTV